MRNMRRKGRGGEEGGRGHEKHEKEGKRGGGREESAWAFWGIKGDAASQSSDPGSTAAHQAWYTKGGLTREPPQIGLQFPRHHFEGRGLANPVGTPGYSESTRGVHRWYQGVGGRGSPKSAPGWV